MKRLQIYFTLIFLSIAVFASCDLITGYIVPENYGDVVEEALPGDQAVILGDKFGIIPTLSNVAEALKADGRETGALHATAYYVRFNPKTGSQLLDVMAGGVHLSEVPFDRNISTLGTWYRDPSASDAVPTYQYAVLSKDEWDRYQNSVLLSWTLLAELCMPDPDRAGATGVPDDWYESALESWCGRNQVSGHLVESGDWWTPEGTVMAWDSTAMRMVPVKGVEVEIRHLLRVRTAVTDENGRFRSPGAFRGDVSCRVYWRSGGSAGWSVRAGSSQAFFEASGPFGPGEACDIEVPGGNTYSAHHSLMYRAAYRAFMEDSFGLSLQMKGRLGRPLFLCYVHGTLDHGEGATTLPNVNPGVVPEIRVSGKSLSEWMPQDKFFCVTCHELGHVSHYLATSSDYFHTDSVIKEGWAQFVRYFLGEGEYRSLGAMPQFIGTWYALPGWTYKDSGGLLKTAWNGATVEMLQAAGVSPRHYWGEEVSDGSGKTVRLFDNPFNGKSMQSYRTEDFLVDFYDDIDQSVYFNGTGTSNDGKAPDTVSGYTVLEIRDIVWKSHTLNDIYTYLVNAASAHGTMAGAIEDIFNNYGLDYTQ